MYNKINCYEWNNEILYLDLLSYVKYDGKNLMNKTRILKQFYLVNTSSKRMSRFYSPFINVNKKRVL